MLSSKEEITDALTFSDGRNWNGTPKGAPAPINKFNFIMDTLKKPIYFILLLAFIFELFIYTGFCFKQFRYISDDEKIRIAIDYVLKENRKNILQYKDRAVIFPFNTVDEFIASKPTIMGIAYSLDQGGTDCLNRLFGYLSSYVVLEFIGGYKNRPEKVLTSVAITNCGDAWDPMD
ncbi:hypothetical protein [Methylomonas methanica]|uniref:Uncharacterized protein n=1 Tax=Methylomonas methanica (strain DSM 25384 / MC09) TaxID=857087 RepID=G0A0V1_METMM|nr:hypothetical protein [Methylomonas methanica]AEG00036.1 hypothetical protein Metme_1617 [Methylomonas methanica MC09]